MRAGVNLSLSNPYQAYVEGDLFGGNPLEMVVALYEGAAFAVRQAKTCLATGDIQGRSKAVNKAFAIITELLASLDHERGGEISANLKRLYSYMQCKLLDSHTQQTKEPLDEVERLLDTMLEGWRLAAEKMTTGMPGYGSQHLPDHAPIPEEERYGLFSENVAELAGCVSALF